MRTHICFRLNEHYDRDLILHLNEAKNISRELRRIIRVGIKAMATGKENKQKKVVACNERKR